MPDIDFKGNPNDRREGFDAVPAGFYLVVIKESSIQQIRDNKGELLKLKYEVVDGPYKGRIFYNNLNLWHNGNADAKAHAERSMTNICMILLGKPNVKRTEELHDKPLVVKVSVGEFRGEPNNSVKQHYLVNDKKARVGSATAGVDVQAGGPVVVDDDVPDFLSGPA
jgi:hypothetical protein